ncbi:MAG TPA: hypothetical protein VFO44_15295, partial [Steroidobacteraceae bacterium]|nr:hypothetical protein [Steroidobacteraceae bacterium]
MWIATSGHGCLTVYANRAQGGDMVTQGDSRARGAAWLPVLASLLIGAARYACAEAQSAAPAPPSAASDASGDSLEEIVVTARRRSESIQQVPIAISVLDEATLQRQDVRTLSDLQLLVPSAYVSGFSHGSSQQFF